MSSDGAVPTDTVPFVRRVTKHAYRAGASLVTTLYADEISSRARFRYAKDDRLSRWLAARRCGASVQEGAAGLFLLGDGPTLLAAEERDKV